MHFRFVLPAFLDIRKNSCRYSKIWRLSNEIMCTERDRAGDHFSNGEGSCDENCTSFLDNRSELCED